MKQNIIPSLPVLVHIPGEKHVLHYEAIAVFAALGFFLDRDTYWKDQSTVPPATDYALNENGELMHEKQYFEWHHSPRQISFETAVEEFTELFESSVRAFHHQKVILPLSGGLDSRSIAAALLGHTNVQAYSYHFKGGIAESEYGKKIARAAGFPFQEFIIPEGYLWKDIERLAQINGCYAEFTHPRQMYMYDALPGMGDVMVAGHGGDLFFDGMGVDDALSFEAQIQYLLKKLIRKGGRELAEALWEAWGLQGSFMQYLTNRLESLLNTLPIDNANARLRAFKSKYYVARWTQVNMQVFLNQRPVFTPYFTDEMCRFICTVPEEHLKGRKIQIEYMKRKAPQLAAIAWQSYAPLNLYNYHRFFAKERIPYRIADKLKRVAREKIAGKKLITRNWELQFTGKANDEHLKEHLFQRARFQDIIPETLTRKIYTKFHTEDPVRYSHPLSMLLTLSEFAEIYT